MARRLKKKFKYTFIILLLVIIGFGGYKCYKIFSDKQDKEVKEKIKKEEEKDGEEVIEIKPYEEILNDNGIFKDYYIIQIIH